MNITDTLRHAQTPTALRPLLGVSILLVEDSITICESIRVMALRSGARLRRADCLESARRHLSVYCPTVLLVDMGLPDGSGADLIAEVTAAQPPIDTIIALSADADQRHEAIQAGANGFLEKPIKSIAAFQAAIIPYLPQVKPPSGSGAADDNPIPANTSALQEDLAHALNLLREGEADANTHRYLATFLAGVASAASDAELTTATAAFAAARAMTGTAKEALATALTTRLQGWT